MPLPRARFPVLVALALVLVALAVLAPGCGSEPVTVASRTLTLRVDEFRIVPQDLRVRAGRLRIVAENVGRLTHNVRIVKIDPDDRERSPEMIGGTQTAQPGDTVSATLEQPLPPGEYRILCSIANHDDLGQYGTLTVVPDPGA